MSDPAAYGSDTWETVQAFAREMEEKLSQNRHKGGWLTDDPLALLHRVMEEVVELQHAIDQGAPSGEIIEEAADVANMAMMVADAYSYQRTQRGLVIGR